jgi:deoxyhypusine synthase
VIAQNFLKKKIQHIDIKKFNSIPLIDEFEHMALQAKNLARAAKIYDKMIIDTHCTIILTLAGSLFSAGLKKVVYDMIKNKMVDVIVSTGAIIFDQDFFEALGYRHYQGNPIASDTELMKLKINRIYDTYKKENELETCDSTIASIADGLPPRPHSSREFIVSMGEYLDKKDKKGESVVWIAYKTGVPIFIPAFSDSSAGIGLISHQWKKTDNSKVTIDSVKDFLELTKIKIASENTGVVILGGGVPKNFAQDVTVAADSINKDTHMHKYAIQITVADERDGGLSGSTLKEAHSWRKVDWGFDQMVFSESTIALPLIASYVYHKGNWENRSQKNYNLLLDTAKIGAI